MRIGGNFTATSTDGGISINANGESTLNVSNGNTELNALGDIAINTSDEDSSVTLGGDLSITSNSNVVINAGDDTAEHSLQVSGDTTMSADLDIWINKWGGNDSANFTDTATIKGRNIYIGDGATFNSQTELTAVTDLYVQGSRFVEDATLTAGGTVLLSDVISQNVDYTTNQGLQVTGTDIYVQGSGNGLSRYGNDTQMTADNDLVISGTVFDGPVDSVGQSDHSILTAGRDIFITDSLDDPSVGSRIGDYTEIRAGDGLYIYGPETSVGNNVDAEAENMLYLKDIRIDNDSSLRVNSGTVVISNVQSGIGTVISSVGVAGGETDWHLEGADTNIRGALEMNDDLDIVYVREGYYDTIRNQTGDMELTFFGGKIGTIDNSSSTQRGSTDAGNSTITLAGHTNTQDPSETQSIEHIKGNADGTDELYILSGVRFTEYVDPADNYDNPARGGAVDPDRYPQNNQITSITDFTLVHLAAGTADSRTGLEIGTRDGNSNGVLFESESVYMESFTDLFLHQADPLAGEYHKADEINIVGSNSILWLDRSTITNYTAGKELQITISGTNSMITGYMTRTAAGFTDYNIIGNLAMGNGTIIKPYHGEFYDPLFYIERECTMDGDMKLPLFNEALSQSGVGLAIDGELEMAGGAVLDIRIFTTDDDNHTTTINEYDEYGNVIGSEVVNASSSDFVQVSGDANFTGTARLNVTFGNDNELTAKIGDRYGSGVNYEGFNVYSGNGNEDTYYYSIVRSESGDITMNGLTGVNIDENATFDGTTIFKSDMLGSWDTMVGSTGDEILLRFRLLAKHPVDGGIASDMHEPNAVNAAAQIDRIRYPFDHDDIHVRYDGDMVAYYSSNPDLFPNYQYKYIKDFEDLLLAIQNNIASGSDLYKDIRMLHPEPYADLANLNLNLMDQFIKVREQHGVSSLFAVEVDDYATAVAEAEAWSERRNGSAYASIYDDDLYCTVDQFVCNPVRFWTAGFGAKADQKNVGTEYGYDTEVWGAAVGVVKEFGDLYFGLTGGYARSDVSWNELSAGAKTDAYMADFLVGYRRGLGFVEAFGNYAYSEHDVTRVIAIPGYNNGVARGDYHDDVWGGGIRFGYQARLGKNWLMIPTIGVNYIQTKSGSFTESGRHDMAVLLDFAKGGIKRRNVRAPLTVRVNRSFAACGFVVTPEFRGSVSAIFGNKSAKAYTRFVGDPGANSEGIFYANGIKTGRWAAQLGTSLEISRRGRFNLTGNYDYTFAKKSHEHNYSLMAGMNF
ncbi:MAG: autotransporter outer membrane beta-barrel domain-containing protein [Planctomycetes bacterium]|nr:autotransporter outer membrane beta-barrel domain-containing protein [Planctomycetota bacterium]